MQQLFPHSGPRSYRFLRMLLQRQINLFEHSVHQPDEAQRQVLKDILFGIHGTVLSDKFQLGRVKTLDEYRSAVPIQHYSDIEPLIHRTVLGERRVMSREKVTGFVETSGTQAHPKLIPITKSWSSHIRQAQLLWVLGLIRDFPSIAQGDIVHIVSSATERLTQTGLPIGANTGRMVDALPKGIQKRFVLSGVPAIEDSDLRHYVHLRLILQHSIRMWVTANPSTIALYARKLDLYKEWLARDLRKGTLREGPAETLSEEIRTVLEAQLKPAAVPRYWTLAQALPLSVIGCWTGGPAQWFVRQFPDLLGAEIPVRDVGITASEGYFGIPLASDWNGGVLWNRGELLEFQDDSGHMFWGWELQQGQEYSLVISAKNGLLRYAMQDRVRVTGFYGVTPIVAFVGKAGRFLNAVGEKVTEEQVALAMEHFAKDLIGFTTSIEWAEIPKIHLGVEWRGAPQIRAEKMAVDFDAYLQQISVEYASKRQSQRLGMPNVSFWTEGTYSAFRQWRIGEGASAAQVKDCVIATDKEWTFFETHSRATL